MKDGLILTRRKLIQMSALAVTSLMGMSNPAYAQSPAMAKWVDPLPVPPVATTTVKPSISSWADYYDITMTASQHQFSSELGPATVWTYGQPGKAPVLLGPTIVAKTGRPAAPEGTSGVSWGWFNADPPPPFSLTTWRSPVESQPGTSVSGLREGPREPR